MDRTLRIAAFATSLRRGSWNRRLLDRAIDAVEEVDGHAVDTDLIDLRRYPLPLYDADMQARDGLPAAALAVHDRIAEADAVLVANPEYNGGYPALFKNLVDWVSRVDMFVFHPRYVGLLSATPGKGGGARGIAHTKSLFDNIFVTSHPEGFALPRANEVLTDDDTWQSSPQAGRLQEWSAGFVAAATAHAEAQADAA